MNDELARAADPMRTDWRQAPEHIILAHHELMESKRRGDAGSRADPTRSRSAERSAKSSYDSTLHSRGDRESCDPRI